MNYFTQNCKEQQEETLIHVAFCSPALFLGFRSYNWRIWANRNKLRPLFQQDSIISSMTLKDEGLKNTCFESPNLCMLERSDTFTLQIP